MFFFFVSTDQRKAQKNELPVPTTGIFHPCTMHTSAPRHDAPEVPDLSAY